MPAQRKTTRPKKSLSKTPPEPVPAEEKVGVDITENEALKVQLAARDVEILRIRLAHAEAQQKEILRQVQERCAAKVPGLVPQSLDLTERKMYFVPPDDTKKPS